MSSEDYEIFDQMRRERQKRRNKRLEASSDFGWQKHTDTHWYRFIDEEKLHWWPSANKWLFKGKYYRGALPKFLLERIDEQDRQLKEAQG